MPNCSTCLVEQSLEHFYIHSNGKPRKQCKSCLLKNPNRKAIPRETWNKYSQVYREENKELCLERSRRWRKSNLAYNRYRSMLYNVRKQNQTPIWADLLAIKQIYLDCPEGYHVDHIIPLKGKNVCGLHVAENLQYLTPTENYRKGNRYAELF